MIPVLQIIINIIIIILIALVNQQEQAIVAFRWFTLGDRGMFSLDENCRAASGEATPLFRVASCEMELDGIETWATIGGR